MRLLFILWSGMTFATSVDSAIDFVAGPPNASTSSLVANPNTQVADGTATIGLSTTFRDSYGNRVGNANVTLTASGGNTTFAPPVGKTDATGYFAATMQGTKVQTETIKATTDGNVFVTTSVTFVVGPASATTSTFTTNIASAPANNSNVITLTVKLYDSLSHPISGKTASFSASGPSTTINPTTCVTNAFGICTTTYRSSVAQNANALIAVSGLNATRSITFTANPVSCSLVASPNTQVADSNTPITVTATVYDGNSVVVAAQPISFLAVGGASCAPTAATTDAAGTAQLRVTSMSGGRNTLYAHSVKAACQTTVNFSTRAASCAGSPNYTVRSLSSLTSSSGIAKGDFNKDGFVDVVATSNGTDQIAVFLGNANGIVSAPVFYTTPDDPIQVAVGDLLANGNQSIVTTNYGGNSVAIFHGNGDGTFNTPTYLSTGSLPVGITLGDFDADGIVDILVAPSSGATANFFKGAGNGSFAAAVNISLAGPGEDITVGDLNNDGMLDFIVGSKSSSTISIVTGKATGGFNAYSTITAQSYPRHLAVGDFNQDGNQDIAAANRDNSTISIHMNRGNGTFVNAVIYNVTSDPDGLALGDMNGDGIADLLISGSGSQTVQVMLGKSGGTFNSPLSIPIGLPGARLVAADFNRNGFQDMAVSTDTGSGGTLLLLTYASCGP
jgi:hypothetical protein